MTNDNNTVSGQNVWEQKGLGWLPDYPDLRDYQLDKQEINKRGKLNVEETTDNIEELADSLIQALKLIQKIRLEDDNNAKSNPNEFEVLIRKLQNKVFGNINFLNVKLRKILRPIPKKLNLFSSSLPFSYYKDNLSKQTLLELKTYLYLLFTKNPKLRKRLINHKEIKLIRTDIVKAIQWLKDPDFDDTTVIFLKEFQKLYEIPDTGVIGPLTYNALHREFYPKPSTTDSGKSFPLVQLISISSLVPSEIIQALFEELISICAQRLKETEAYISEEKIFGQNFLQGKRAEYSGAFFNGTSSSPSQTVNDFLLSHFPRHYTEEKKIIEWLSVNQYFWFTITSKSKRESCDYVETRDKLFLEMSCKVFNNEFKVIEPLVSVLLKLIMPLASGRYCNWSEAIVDGLHQFEASIKYRKDTAGIPPEANNEKQFLQFLAIEALQKTCQEIEEGVKLVTGEIENLRKAKTDLTHEANLSSNSTPDSQAEYSRLIVPMEARCQEKESILGATLFFYFLINEFVEYYKKLIDEKSLPKNNIEDGANLFDKREMLEIENPECFYRGDFLLHEQEKTDGNQDPKDVQLFPTETLQVPVLINLSRLLGLNYLNSRTSAYFFLPGVVDLSFWCTPVRDQGGLRSCAAIAGVALIEYFVNRSRNKSTYLSPLFLYQVARKQLNLTEDVGTSLRETMKAMALHGVPPESVWEYDPANVNTEPPPFCYSYAQNYQALKYFRLDYAGISAEVLLFQIKAMLAAGFPCMFGFTLYSSTYEETNAKQGWIPFPDAKRDKVRGGHAVVAVGYDDYKLIPRADRTGDSFGAFLIRNCWGKSWGKFGYGWLPYDYIRQELTYDWWSLLKAEWFDADLLGVGANNLTGGHRISKYPP